MNEQTATDNERLENRQTSIRVGVAGCSGRVGRLLCQELLSGHWAGLSIAGGTVRQDYAGEKDIGSLLGQAPVNAPVFNDPEDLFAVSDMVIDFTAPQATARHIWLAAKHHKPLIIGTTGLSLGQEQEIQDAAKECAIVYAANMSIGVNLLIALIEKAAARLGPEWDIEIAETHHRHKVDAPSGTALALGKAAAKGRGEDFESVKTPAREGDTGERERGTIGFATQRGGDIVGEHTVSFFGMGERIELSHRATDRTLFARGALHAALWLRDRPKGLYKMQDVLGL